MTTGSASCRQHCSPRTKSESTSLIVVLFVDSVEGLDSQRRVGITAIGGQEQIVDGEPGNAPGIVVESSDVDRLLLGRRSWNFFVNDGDRRFAADGTGVFIAEEDVLLLKWVMGQEPPPPSADSELIAPN